LKFIILVSYKSGEPLRNLPNLFGKRSSIVIASHPSAYSFSHPSFNLNYSSSSSLSSPSIPPSIPPSSPFPSSFSPFSFSFSSLFFSSFSSSSPSSSSFSPFSLLFSLSIGVISTIRGDICWSSFYYIVLLSNLYRRQVVIGRAALLSGRLKG